MKASLAALAGVMIISATGYANEPPAVRQGSAKPMERMSLEDLLRREVTSVSRRPEQLADTAAAIFVISAEEIERTGVRSVPEALRLSPGVEAFRISANRWSISIRGGAERFANKLLLLVDGRNTYSPAFSGVFWESVLPPLGDIARIEVIRGPGAAAWGPNAVNGVINIITKSAAATHGFRARAGGGTREGAFASLTYGDELRDSSLHYRAYLRGQNGRAFELEDRPDANDEFDNVGAGLRMDGYLQGGARWDMSLDASQVNSDNEALVPALVPAGFLPRVDEQSIDSYSLRGRYQRALRGGAQLELLGSAAYTDAEVPVLGRDERATYEAEAQYQFGEIGAHAMRVGASLLHSRDEISDGRLQQITDSRAPVSIYSLFAEDNIALSERVSLTFGLRLDDHEFSGVEVQPTLRALWNISRLQSLWGAVSRAARTPSRGERSFNYTVGIVPPGVPLVLQGNEDFDSEYVTAAEAGYRAQLSARLFSDITLFYHQYEDLRSFSAGPGGIPMLVNGGELDVYGSELSITWRPVSDLSTTVNYSYSETTNARNQTLESGLVPRHIASLHLAWDIHSNLGADLTAYHVDERNSDRVDGFPRYDAFTSVNLALRWRVAPPVTLRLVGQDLLESRQSEGIGRVPRQPDVLTPRGVFADVSVKF